MLFKNSLGFFYLLSLFFISQNPDGDIEKIDALLNKAKSAYARFDDSNCLEYARKASALALNAGDKTREAEGYFLSARVLASLEKQKESMAFIQKAEDLGYAKSDKVLKAKLWEIKSFNYNTLSLFSLSMQENKAIINLLKNTASTESFKVQARANSNISIYYHNQGKAKIALQYLKNQEDLLKKVPENEVITVYNELIDTKGYIYLEENNMDSALYYFDKGYDYKKKHDMKPLMYIAYCAYGDYYNKKGEVQKALDYYLKTLQNIKEYNVNHSDYIEVYKNISELYGKLKDYNNETLYLKQYLKIHDSIDKQKEIKIDHVTHSVLNEKEHHHKRNIFWIVLGSTVFGICVFYLLYRKYAKAKKNDIISRNLIIDKENETKSLKLKLNESFDELIGLAKHNHPHFYTRFREVYPDFQKKLLEINPELNISELTLSAYIYLDFQTKEIADYTFKSFRTIQNQKNRLRKKLNLSSAENLNVWFKTLMTAS